MPANALFRSQNNSQVVGISTSKELKDIGYVNNSLLASLDLYDNKVQLGMVNLFENCRLIKVPFLREMLENQDVINVNGRQGGFRYKVPMDLEYPIVVEKVEETDFPGIDGIPFTLRLSHPFRQGDILGYDMDGVQVYVLPDSEVVDTGQGYDHSVAVASNNREDYFPVSKLVPGTRFFKLGNILAEGSTQYSGITGVGTPRTVELEYTIGAPQGVEVTYTDFANSIMLDGKENSQIMDSLLKQAYSLGDMSIDGTQKNFVYESYDKEGNLVVQKVDSLMRILALAELYKMKAARMMFGHAFTVTGLGGASAKVNDGLYPQLRRGHRFTYRNEVELRAMIRMASDVIFTNMPIRIDERFIRFRAGHQADRLVRQLFKQEFNNTMPMLQNSDAFGGKPALEGADRYNMEYKSFAIKKAFLDGIGNVELEHDPSLDYDFGDSILRGYSAGFSKRSWSLVIYDVTDPMSSNVYSNNVMPAGVEVDKRSQGKNVYIVKPDNMGVVNWGTETGRMSGQNVKSAHSYMGETFWCNSQADVWVKDLSRVILIEREDAITEDSI